MALFIATPKGGKSVDLYADNLADAMEVVRPGVEVRGPYLCDVAEPCDDCPGNECKRNEPEGGCLSDPD